MSVGLLVFTIGGFIDMVTNPKGWNDRLLQVARHGGRTGVDLSNPKARPWAIAGLVLLGCGLIVLVAT